ncbi:MAG: SRPBCC domain-containing protein [Candidatus Aquilonibacter sp.]
MNKLETADDVAEVVKTRTFDAPLSLVWKVWTEVEHRNQWWGRAGFTTVCEHDLRPGGKMSIHMQGPDATIHISGTFEEVIANERLVTAGVLEIDGVAAFNTRLDVSFAEQAGTTSVTVRHTYWNFAGDRKDVIDGTSVGWTQQFERLEAYLRALRSQH